jgi:hypothetical protein
MQVRFYYPKGMEGWDRDIDMDYVPRVGESIVFGSEDDSDEFEIRHVTHIPRGNDFQAYVVLKVNK